MRVLNPVSYPEDEVENENRNVVKTKKGLTKYFITVEPIKLFLGFTVAFTNGVTIDLIQRNVCHVNYNRTSSQCWGNMSSQMKSDIEGTTAEMNMLNQIAQGFFPVILVLLIGPWSDTNGRKPFILLPIVGFSLYYLSWAIFSFFPDIPVMYLFIPSIPLGLTGSQIAMYVCTWGYSCDNFSVEERPMRFSISISAQIIGGLLGNGLSGQVVHWGGDYGYQIIYFTSFIVCLISLIYTIFFLEETVVRPTGVARTKLLDFEHIKSIFIVLFVRPEKGLLLSLLIAAVLFSEIPLTAGDDGIIYLVGKTQYNWDLIKFNINAAVSSIISAVSPVFLVWLLMDIIKMDNITVLVLACSVMAVTEVMKCLSINETMFWISTFAVKITSVLGPSIDTELSHTVSESHSGKAFTMTCVGDALTPVMSIPLYTLAYKLFLPSHTLYVFFISAVLGTLATIFSVGLFFKLKSPQYMRQYNIEN